MMIDPEAELTTTLELASMLAEPSLADRGRILQAVRSELALAGAGASAHATARGASASSRVQPRRAAGAKLQGAALQQLITVGVVAAALGFAAGWGLRERTRTAEVAPREVVSLPVPPPASEPEVTSLEKNVAVPAPIPAPVSEATVSEAAEPSTDEPRAEPAPARKARVRKPARSATASTADAPRSPSRDSSEFFEAVNLLRRAQRAVNRGDGQVALSLLTELDTRFDARTLAEERQATRALALCASGNVEAATRVASELARVAPSSIYAGRLRLSCAGWTSPNTAGNPAAERVTEPTTP